MDLLLILQGELIFSLHQHSVHLNVSKLLCKLYLSFLYRKQLLFLNWLSYLFLRYEGWFFLGSSCLRSLVLLLLNFCFFFLFKLLYQNFISELNFVNLNFYFWILLVNLSDFLQFLLKQLCTLPEQQIYFFLCFFFYLLQKGLLTLF